MNHNVNVTVQQEPTAARMLVGLFMVVALVVTFWKFILIWCAVSAACFGLWMLYCKRAAIKARADQQVQWFNAGDPRYLYGPDYQELPDEGPAR